MTEVNLVPQITILSEKGLSPSEIACALEISVDNVIECINANNVKDRGVEDLLKDYQPRVLKRLMTICEDDSIENKSSCVAAGKAILDYSRDITGAKDSLFLEKLARMKVRAEEQMKKMGLIIDVKEEENKILQLTDGTG